MRTEQKIKKRMVRSRRTRQRFERMGPLGSQLYLLPCTIQIMAIGSVQYYIFNYPRTSIHLKILIFDKRLTCYWVVHLFLSLSISFDLSYYEKKSSIIHKLI